jgi:hypothetical protein
VDAEFGSNFEHVEVIVGLICLRSFSKLSISWPTILNAPKSLAESLSGNLGPVVLMKVPLEICDFQKDLGSRDLIHKTGQKNR